MCAPSFSSLPPYLYIYLSISLFPPPSFFISLSVSSPLSLHLFSCFSFFLMFCSSALSLSLFLVFFSLSLFLSLPFSFSLSQDVWQRRSGCQLSLSPYLTQLLTLFLCRKRGRTSVCVCERERAIDRVWDKVLVCVCEREREREYVCERVNERVSDRRCSTVWVDSLCRPIWYSCTPPPSLRKG